LDIRLGDEAALVAAELRGTRTGHSIERALARARSIKGQAVVIVRRGIVARARGKTLARSILEDHAAKLLRALRARAPRRPDGQRAFAPAVRPAEPAVHLGCARPIADSAVGNTFGQAHSRQELVVALDPQRKLGVTHGRELKLE